MDTPEALATLQRVLGADPDVVDRDELGELVAASSRLRGLLDRFDLRCTRRARDLAAAGRAEPPGSMLRRNGNRSTREADKVDRREQAAARMPAFEDSLGSGEVTGEHLDVIANVTTGLPDDVRAAFTDHEDDLLAAARTDTVETFTRRCRTLVRRIAAERAGPGESDAAELDRQRDASAVKRWADPVTGMCHTNIELDPVRNAEMWSAIDAHITRLRNTDGNGHLTWNQLQAQAVVDAVSAGVAVDDVGAATAPPGPARRTAQGGASPIAKEIGAQLAATIAARTPTGTGRIARIPQPAQRVPEITVLIGLDVLIDGTDALGADIGSICETIDGHPLPVSTVRRMCCDAEIIPAVLNSHGEVTDLGRSRRTANRAQRRQLAAMHRTCAHPDCTIAFSACRIHHVTWWWRDHGTTDIDNLVPLCERHHHLVHEGGWGLQLDTGRIATWYRPDGTHWHTGPTIDRTAPGQPTPTRSRRPEPHPEHALVRAD